MAYMGLIAHVKPTRHLISAGQDGARRPPTAAATGRGASRGQPGGRAAGQAEAVRATLRAPLRAAPAQLEALTLRPSGAFREPKPARRGLKSIGFGLISRRSHGFSSIFVVFPIIWSPKAEAHRPESYAKHPGLLFGLCLGACGRCTRGAR